MQVVWLAIAFLFQIPQVGPTRPPTGLTINADVPDWGLIQQPPVSFVDAQGKQCYREWIGVTYPTNPQVIQNVSCKP